MFDQYKILTFFRNNQYVSFTVVLYFLLTETNQLIVNCNVGHNASARQPVAGGGAALLSGDRVSGDGRNETVSLIMTVFPMPPMAPGLLARVTAPASQTGVSGVRPAVPGVRARLR